MSDWLNKWRTIVISLTVISTSLTSNVYGSVACSSENEACLNPLITCDNLLENIPEDSPSSAIKALIANSVACADQNDSYLNSAESEELIEDIVSGMYSCGTKAVATLGLLLRGARSGLSALQKHPLKALTMLLALQNTNSQFRVPGAAGLTVTNLDQLLTYVPDGPAVQLLPMIITPTNNTALSTMPYSATFYLNNSPGNFSSSSSGLTRQGMLGDWVASGTIFQVNTILSSLSFKAALGYRSTITLSTKISIGTPFINEDSASGLSFINPSASDIMVENLFQTIQYDASGSAIPLLPITINSNLDDFLLSISSGYVIGNFTSSVNTPPLTYYVGVGGGASWSARGNKSALNSLLAALYFKPSLTLYPAMIKVFPLIVDARAVMTPTTRISGAFTIYPSATLGTSGSITSQPTTKVVTSSSKVTSSSTTSTKRAPTPTSVMSTTTSTKTQSPSITTRSTGTPFPSLTNRVTNSDTTSTSTSSMPTIMPTTTFSSSNPATTNSATSSYVSTASKAPVMSSTETLSPSTTTPYITSPIDSFRFTLSATPPTSVNSETITSASSNSQNPTNPVDGSTTATLPTSAIVAGTTTATSNGIDQSSSPLIAPTKETLYTIIGGVVGGVVLGGSIIAGIVAFMRKKRSIAPGRDQELPIQQPLSDAHRSAVLPQASATYELIQMQSSANTSCNAFPYASIIYQNDVIQPQAPTKSGYRNLPAKNHYETSMPQHKKNYEENFSTIHKAAQEGDLDLIEVHLGFGVQVDSLNAEGYTALHLAARAGHVDACTLLLNRGANKHLMTKEKQTALLLAKEMGHDLVVTILE